MARGRPKKIGDEICSSRSTHGLGSSYFKIVKKDNKVYYYPVFTHNDHSIKDHRIKNWGPKDERTEYIYSKNETIVYNNYGAHQTKAYPCVIYDLRRLNNEEEVPSFTDLCGVLCLCRFCFGPLYNHDSSYYICDGTTIVWCPRCHNHFRNRLTSIVIPSTPKKLSKNTILLRQELEKIKSPILRLSDIRWFLKTSKKIDSGARELLIGLGKLLEYWDYDFVITYGDKSTEVSDQISFMDKYGILKRLGSKINSREKQKKIYNNPPRILADPAPINSA